ncbi:MAG: Hpt domain-containing protein [Slackia sp.]|nr:Hpt domain-containing protein [Slackia sp.]
MTTLEQAYHELGSDYEGVTNRLMGDALVARFVGKFFEDESFAKLGEALAAQDVKAAFMAAHTLKGVCQNLGLDNLYVPSSELTEVLRAGSLEGADELYAKVAAEYCKMEEVLKPCLQ